jgi:6-phosphogluconolactonase
MTIEAEWWDYDDTDELADAVAGDVGFIIDSALDARGQALIALPGGTTRSPCCPEASMERCHDYPD